MYVGRVFNDNFTDRRRYYYYNIYIGNTDAICVAKKKKQSNPIFKEQVMHESRRLFTLLGQKAFAEVVLIIFKVHFDFKITIYVYNLIFIFSKRLT